jgi:hypothetical protein
VGRAERPFCRRYRALILSWGEGTALDTAAFRRACALATTLLTLALSACGGGGAGSGPSQLPGSPATNAPAPSNPNAPGSPSTPAPGATTSPPSMVTTPPSNPAPGPTAPAPGPATMPPQGSTILPDTTGRFSLIQLADQYGIGNASLTSPQIQTEAPNYDVVYAAFQPQVWNQAHPGMIVSRYVVPWEDTYQISGHDLAYFQQNHPDWILYGCQANGTPTSDYAWSGTLAAFGNDVPLDIHNPAVVQYEMNELAGYLTANGYNAIAVDQATFVNFLTSPNPNLENGNGPNPGWYGCGIYPQGPQNGNFQRVYGPPGGGDLDQPDPTFISDLLNWVATAKSTLGPLGIKVIVNHPPTGATPSGNETTLLNSVDGVVDENGFTDYGNYAGEEPTQFTDTLSWVQAVQGMGKAVFLADYFCQGCSLTSASQLSGAQADWALSTYAIADGGGLGLYTAPQGVGEYSYRPEYSQTYGAPCGPYTQAGSVYMRQFQNGLAVVNASGSPATATLPAGNTYSDVEGRAAGISGTLPLGAADGWMLKLTSGNGCTTSGGSLLRRPFRR